MILQVHLDYLIMLACDVDSWSNSIIKLAKIVIVMTMQGLTQWKEPGNLLTIMMAMMMIMMKMVIIMVVMVKMMIF